jgi:hypothetical protein
MCIQDGLLLKSKKDGLLFIWSVVPSFWFAISVAASQEKPILALRKWKTHFLWDEMKISLHDVHRHPKGHAHVRYDLVSTNDVMIRTKPSSFDLKAMQPRTW